MAVDERNGSATAVRSFKTTAGATYPFLLNGGLNTGGNFITLYGPRDDYVVVSKQHIVRYHAALTWPIGNGYHLAEIRGAIDSLVTPTVGVSDDARPRDYRLVNVPNPFRDRTTFELANPTGRDLDARVALYDLAGRQVASLWDAPLPPGVTRVSWDGRASGGVPVPAGVYFARGSIGAARLSHRVVVLH